jgi:hypothetical protein
MAIAFLLFIVVVAVAALLVAPDSRLDDVARRRGHNG